MIKVILGAMVSLFGGFFLGGLLGMLAINLFPNQCIDGQCFYFLTYQGWEATTSFGALLGASVGLVLFILWCMLKERKMKK